MNLFYDVTVETTDKRFTNFNVDIIKIVKSEKIGCLDKYNITMEKNGTTFTNFNVNIIKIKKRNN